MKIKSLLLTMAVVTLLLPSCVREDRDHCDLEEYTEIYIAGNHGECGSCSRSVSGGDAKEVSCYWTAGEHLTSPLYTKLSGAVSMSEYSLTNSIRYDNGSVYNGGFYPGRYHPQTACYWKDNMLPERFALPAPEDVGESICYSIAVHNGVVYGTGFYESHILGREAGCYWVGDQRHDLQLPANMQSDWHAMCGYDIVVENGTVYVCGQISGPDGERGAYWVDGVYKEIELPVYDPLAVVDPETHVYSMAVSAGKVYIAGHVHSDPSEGIEDFGYYWIDGRLQNFPFPAGTVESDLYDIAVENGKVYAIGKYYVGTDEVLFYSVDGELKLFNQPGEEVNMEIRAIYVLDGVVYVCGMNCSDSCGGDTACYWTDGVRTALPTPAGGSDSMAEDIYVVKVRR